VGVIAATASTKESKIAGSQIVLTGTLSAGGTVDWVCNGGTTAAIDSKYRPASCK
jgi:hypothetical protein